MTQRRTPAHGSVEGLARPPRGDYKVPIPGDDRHRATEVPPVHLPRHGGHVLIRTEHGWTAGLGTVHDRDGRRTYCTWLIAGQIGAARVEGWVSWDDLAAVEVQGRKDWP